MVEHPRTLTLHGSISVSIYYVYIYRHPKTKVPFYVGYGKNQRYLDHLNEAIRYPTPQPTEHKLNTIRKILREGLEPIIEIVDSRLSKDLACELEIFLISEIGRADKNEGPLTNQTMGGDGNRDWTPRLREIMSEHQRGMIMAKDPKTGERIKVHKDDPRWVSGELVGINKGKQISEETKNKMCLALKGVPKSKEHNKKVSDSMKLLKWYCNFEQNVTKRFREGEQPLGFVRVSGPHKRTVIEQ